MTDILIIYLFNFFVIYKFLHFWTFSCTRVTGNEPEYCWSEVSHNNIDFVSLLCPWRSHDLFDCSYHFLRFFTICWCYSWGSYLTLVLQRPLSTFSKSIMGTGEYLSISPLLSKVFIIISSIPSITITLIGRSLSSLSTQNCSTLAQSTFFNSPKTMCNKWPGT